MVRTTPDESGRYVIWDLHPGSYDRHLEWLARQRAEHDPPPMTRQRLLELVAAVTSSDDATRRLAQHDLSQAADEQYWALIRAEYEPEQAAFNEAYAAAVHGVGAMTHGGS